jgi:hypothetical protein
MEVRWRMNLVHALCLCERCEHTTEIAVRRSSEICLAKGSVCVCPVTRVTQHHLRNVAWLRLFV